MMFDQNDLSATLIHELKNHLSLLALTIDNIPLQNDKAHDKPVEDARLLCQQVVDRLQQALLIYKAVNGQIRPSIDAYSPEDLIRELSDTAVALSRGGIEIATHIDSNVPPIWFFDRNLIEMALLNAIHNSLAYARTKITLAASIHEEMLSLSVKDDSTGYPEHVLNNVDAGSPFRAVGTGLGLQFAKLIVQTHVNKNRVGTLRLSNDAGAVFQLLVP